MIEHRSPVRSSPRPPSRTCCCWRRSPISATAAPPKGRSIIDNAWVYTLSLAVYCTAWTYFGSAGRAATSGVWFLPIYLGPTLAMVLAWTVVRKMIRIAKTYRITSIADFIGSRYGKSPLLAGLVTLITVVGIVPYIALQLKAIAVGYALLTTPEGAPSAAPASWWHDSTFYVALVLAGFTIAFGARRLDSAERHEGMVAAIAFESVVKLAVFLAVGLYVAYGLFDGLADLYARVSATPGLSQLLRLEQGGRFAYEQWFALVGLSMLSVIFLPRQFQVMVVENVDERHLRRAAWAFPLYLLLINLFVLPIAFGGLLVFGSGTHGPGRLRPVAAAGSRPAGARAGSLHRRSVGCHRHGDSGDHSRFHDDLQRPADALVCCAPAASALARPSTLPGPCWRFDASPSSS